MPLEAAAVAQATEAAVAVAEAQKAAAEVAEEAALSETGASSWWGGRGVKKQRSERAEG